MISAAAKLGLRRRSMTATPCPLCAAIDGHFVLQRTEPLRHEDGLVRSTLASAGDVVEFRGCPRCGLIFRAPRPTAQHLKTYYESVLPTLEPEILGRFKVTHEIAAARNARRYADLHEDLRQVVGLSQGHIVDLGGWDGQSLLPWERAGWQVTLIEPGHETRSLASPTIHAFHSPREAIEHSPTRADILTSYHCIEHLLDIRAWLKDTQQLSRPGTLWVIEVPFELISVRGLLGSSALHAPQIHDEHLNFFTPQSLGKLAEILGLQTIATRVVITQYWFGPTVALRLYARDVGGRAFADNVEPSFRSAASMRRYLAWHMLAWRRWAGLKFRAHRYLGKAA